MQKEAIKSIRLSLHIDFPVDIKTQLWSRDLAILSFNALTKTVKVTTKQAIWTSIWHGKLSETITKENHFENCV